MDLQLMEEFDFKTSINTSVIYSDSDDDFCSRPNKLSKNVEVKNEIDDICQLQKDLDMPSLDDQSISSRKNQNDIGEIIKNTIIRDVTKINDEKRPAKRKLSITSEESNKNTQSITNLEDKGDLKGDGSNEGNANSPTKRKSPDHNSICVLPATQQNQFTKEQVESSKTSNVVNNENESQYAIDSTRIAINHENSFTTPMANERSQVFQDQNSFIVPLNIPESSIITNPNYRHPSSPGQNSSLQSLLNVLYIHLMLIIKAQKSYTKKIAEDQRHRLYYENKYLWFKSHLYYLSYSAALLTILPKENDEEFAKYFIQNTITFAKNKSISCSEEQIRTLYRELIHSVKNTKHQILGYYKDSPRLSQLLLSKSSNTNDLVQKESTVLSSTTENEHQPIQEFNQQRPYVPIDSSTFVVDNVRHQVNDNPFKNMRYKPLRNIKRNEKKSNQGQKEPNANTSANHPDIIRQSPSYNTTVNRNAMIHPSASKEFSYQTVTTPYYPMHSSGNMNNLVNINYSNTSLEPNSLRPTNDRDTFHTKSVNSYLEIPENIVHGIEQSLANIGTSINETTPTGQYNLQHHQQSNSQMPSNQSQPMLFTMFNGTTSPGNQISTHIEVLPQHTPDGTYRSSISRDSGFYSPPNIDKDNDQLQQGNYMQQPLITHVTSLNPNIVNIAEGHCNVCRKLTNKKCLACYNTYYCSYGCQSSDWKYHMGICKI